MKKRFDIPIYDAVLWIVTTKSIAKERRKWEHVFGPSPASSDIAALCSYGTGHTFALFFEPKPDLKIVAHEVFHLAHRIMDWAGANFDGTHHEQGALLNGYLMDLVARHMKVIK